MKTILEIDLLRTFVAFADSGSISTTAGRVNRTQSAVSMQMKRLQEAAGCELLTRVGRNLVVTEDGRRLLGYARRLLMLHEEAISSLRNDAVTGEMHIGILEDFASTYLPNIFTGFADVFPKLRLTIRSETSTALEHAINKSEIDLGILSVERTKSTDVFLCNEPMVWVTSVIHNAHERRPLPLAVFRRNARRQSSHSLDGALDKWGKPFTYWEACIGESRATTQAAVETGLAVAAVPYSLADPNFRILTAADGFPDLPDMKVVLRRTPGSASATVDKVIDFIQHQIAS